MKGWIKTHRSKLDWEWFTDYKTAHLFEYLLLCASHNNFNWRGKKFVAGQLPFGYEKASAQTGLSVRMLRTSLSKLIATNEVTKQSSRKGTVITIVNWEKYQMETNEATSKTTNKRQTNDKQTTSTKNDKNDKNDKNKEIASISDKRKNKFDLEQLYLNYPRKEGKAKGIEKLQSEIKTKDMYDKINSAIINYSKIVKANGIEKKYIKMFSTWVNQKSWEDEIEVPLTQKEKEAKFVADNPDIFPPRN